MPATYEPIATTTLGAAAASINFTSIAASYTDLRVVLTGTGTAALSERFRFNSDTATNYSYTILYGNGSAAGSGRGSNVSFIRGTFMNSWDTTIPVMVTLDLFSYTGSTNKTCLLTVSQDLNGSGSVERSVGLWRSTSAVNNIEIYASTSTFAAGTTATLYGILKA